MAAIRHVEFSKFRVDMYVMRPISPCYSAIRRLVHGRFPHRARCPGMLFPRSFVTQPSPLASSDNP